MQVSGSARPPRLQLVPKKFTCQVCDNRCEEVERGECDHHPSVCENCLCPCFEQNLVNLEVELMLFPGVFDLLIFQTVIKGEMRICLTVPRFQGVDLGGGKMRLEMASISPEQLREKIASSSIEPETRMMLLESISKAGEGQPAYLLNIPMTTDDLAAIGLEELADAPWGEQMKKPPIN